MKRVDKVCINESSDETEMYKLIVSLNVHTIVKFSVLCLATFVAIYIYTQFPAKTIASCIMLKQLDAQTHSQNCNRKINMKFYSMCLRRNKKKHDRNLWQRSILILSFMSSNCTNYLLTSDIIHSME